MRLFETTGVGAFLLTDNEHKLSDLFVPDREAVTYSSPEDAIQKIEWYLGNDREREDIAAAGRARTMSVHTYRQRAAQIMEYVAKYAD
jgi:spore maturation protein CgeB